MECWFKIRDRLVKMDPVKVTWRLFNWMWEINPMQMHMWVVENEGYVDFLCILDWNIVVIDKNKIPYQLWVFMMINFKGMDELLWGR